jgi:hypothetical protein
LGTIFAAEGINPTPAIVSRTVKVTCSQSRLFTAALVARRNIDMNGNEVLTDSFDSEDPAKSTFGQYDKDKYKGDKGDVATNEGIINTVNANIYGHAHTGVGPNKLILGPNGGVGSHEWQATHKGIQDGWWLQDANFTFPQTSLPDTSGYYTPTGGVQQLTRAVTSSSTTNVAVLPSTVPPGATTNYNTIHVTKEDYPDPGTFVGTVKKSGYGWAYDSIVGTNYSYKVYSTNIVTTTNFYSNIMWGTGDASQTNYYVVNSGFTGTNLIVGGNVVLVLPDGFTMGPNDALVIAPGADVVVYAGGTSCTLNGQGVMNQPGTAASFILLCADSVKSLTLNGNSGFTGVIVAPSVDLALNGGGTDPIDINGSVMVNSARFNGHFNFHYDEALSRYSLNGRFLVTSWNELRSF